SGVAGVSMLVINHGETIFQENLGYSNVAEESPVTSDTIFHIASMTKSFTATCINQLRVEGKLRLEDTIQEIIPEARSRDPIVAQFATVADLLGHRTGLQKADQYWLGSAGELMFDREQTTAIFNQLRSVRSFRSTFKYNNIGYAMLGEIILRLTGKTYDKYLEQNVLAPLSMTRT
ncbi:beta-lactamase/transpeptidase-like protein, partial [Leptodontidium sp. MPI-SDFR-AT-0119]